MRTLIIAGAAVLALSACADDGGDGGGRLEINEVQAYTEGQLVDFIELVNVGDETLDASGLKVTDGAPGAPNLTHALTLPPGTTVPVGERVTVAANDAAGCPFAGLERCFSGDFGIKSGGESVLLLTSDDRILSEVAYPGAAVAVGQAWGRLPDATGEFQVVTPTPGEPNAP